MKLLPLCITSLLAGAVALSTAGVSVADDGEMFRKNVSKNADEETEHAALKMLPLFVPPQGANGEPLEPIEVLTVDGTLAVTQDYVQPLITHYTEGHVEGIDEEGYGGFPGHGHRDAFGAVSLDGGASWKNTNLSKSADLSSIKVRVDRRKEPYPGDVGRSFLAADGNQVLVVWVSRYASGGNPNYAMDETELGLVAEYLAAEGRIDDVSACTDLDLITTPCLYLEDHFAVAGSQGVSDLADEGLPLIGELPYAAVWAARGVLLPPTAEGEPSNFVWFKAERLSSAVRDANRPEAVCVKGAGCVVTWQEDPDGIRPGDGEGPGEGWSGAVAHHQTDIWYSYIDWGDFSLVQADDGGYGTFYTEPTDDHFADLQAWLDANETGTPAAAIPMSIPVRLTDNSMCVAEGDKPYCYADFDGSGTADFCASSVSVAIETPEGPTTNVDMCITEDGRLMRGNTASTRARLGLHGYSTTEPYDFGELADNSLFRETIDSAWFYMAYEENKGLGEDGEAEVVSDDPADKIDMGKNVWYHTFDMFTPELVSQGLMLNQPAIYPDDFSDPLGLLTKEDSLGYNFFIIDPDPIYETQAGLETTLYQAEIARRPSPISQDFYDAGPSGTVALQLWKQGIIRRGGPADIMGRLFVIPAGVDGTTEICTLETTTYEICTTTYEEWRQSCEWVEQWVDYERNPVYKPNPGQCKGDDMPLKCYEFIDLEGNPTNDPGTNMLVEVCDDGAWVPVDFCEVGDTCRTTTTCLPAGYCEEGVDEGCTVTVTSETVDSCDDLENCTCVEEPTTAFDSTTENPYDYANMACEQWAFTDGSNPRYVKGFCAEPAINLSGNTILVGEDCADAVTCLEAFPFSDYFDDLAGGLPISKINEWIQTGPGFETDPATLVGDDINSDDTNLNDTSWANPYDVAKGHRGFMAGDMIMAMYAWSPNWKALTDAHDVFNLYARRSFDGGKTWSTTPASFTHTDGITYSGAGTTTCEWMMAATCDSGVTASGECAVCTDYAAGEFEQARNLSQLTGSQVTVLDPRYSPTTRSITETSITTLLPLGFTVPYTDDYDAIRDPSRFFMVYETGQNSAYDEGEATPLDLFYSRAITWGDDYLVWLDEADEAACLPSADLGLTGFCNEFDALEGWADSESGEASITASPGGMFFYAVWNQVDFENDIEVASDAWFRRVLFLDDYVPVTESAE